MRKTILVLPDGTEVSSGIGTVNAVQSCTYTECVNSGTELTLGSVCAAAVELKLITPHGGLSIAAGDALTVYKDDGTTRHKLGIFIAEKPVRPSAHTLRVTAYDRISLLDTDMTDWLAAQTDWPMPLYTLAQRVCEACGLELVNTQIPNGSFPVAAFSAQGITGRQLMQWIGEASGRFCRATADGRVEFAWYGAADGAALQPTDIFQGSLSQGDYQVSPIEKVQLQTTQDDVGVIWPNETDKTNTYRITGNLLLAGGDPEALQTIAQTLYAQLSALTYTPCSVSVSATPDIRAGSVVTVTDRDGRTITMYVMTRKQTGQKNTLECTGSHRRDSVTAVNQQTYQALSGKVLELRTEVEGIRAENADAAGRAASLALTVDGIESQVAEQKTAAENLHKQLTAVAQTASQLSVTVQSLQDNGAGRVTTETGYVFDRDGLVIARTGQSVENRLDHTGMYVTRSGETLLQANDDGVTAADVQVHNYLCVGKHARFEDYSSGRTACFYIGG